MGYKTQISQSFDNNYIIVTCIMNEFHLHIAMDNVNYLYVEFMLFFPIYCMLYMYLYILIQCKMSMYIAVENFTCFFLFFIFRDFGKKNSRYFSGFIADNWPGSIISGNMPQPWNLLKNGQNDYKMKLVWVGLV